MFSVLSNIQAEDNSAVEQYIYVELQSVQSTPLHKIISTFNVSSTFSCLLQCTQEGSACTTVILTWEQDVNSTARHLVCKTAGLLDINDGKAIVFLYAPTTMETIHQKVSAPYGK